VNDSDNMDRIMKKKETVFPQFLCGVSISAIFLGKLEWKIIKIKENGAAYDVSLILHRFKVSCEFLLAAWMLL